MFFLRIVLLILVQLICRSGIKDFYIDCFFYKQENMVPNGMEKTLVLVILGSIVTFSPMFPTIYAKEQTKITSNNSTVGNPSVPLIQKFPIGKSSDSNNNNTIINEDILHRGIISSERGQPDQLKVQRTIILQHRQDGKDYTGVLTFTANKPVEVLLGHRLNVDNNTLSMMEMKKLGDLFLVNPIHPNVGYVLSAPTVIKPDYKGTSPPYYSASVPFVASSVVLRTLGGIPFIAAYEVYAHLGQPQVVNNISIDGNSNSTTVNTK
jgi:hypothetical protein